MPPSLGLGLGLSRYRGGGFSPLAFSPSLWLKADTGLFQDAAKTIPAVADAAPVGAWVDQSGKGHDLKQSVAGSRPILKLTIQNGLPVVRFDGLVDYMTAAYASVQPLTILLSYRSNLIGGVTNDCIFDGGTAASLAMFSRTTPVTNMFAGVSAPTFAGNICNGVFGVFSGMYNGAASDMWLNGTHFGNGPTNVGANNANGFTLGGLQNGTRVTSIDVGELIVYPSALSTAQRQAIESYLKTRWGTP